MEEISIDLDDFNTTTYEIKANFQIMYRLGNRYSDVFNENIIKDVKNYIENFIIPISGIRYIVYQNRMRKVYVRILIILKQDFEKYKEQYNIKYMELRYFSNYKFYCISSGRIPPFKGYLYKGTEICNIITKALSIEHMENFKNFNNIWEYKIENIKTELQNNINYIYITISIFYKNERIFIRTFLGKFVYNENILISMQMKAMISYIEMTFPEILELVYDELEGIYTLRLKKDIKGITDYRKKELINEINEENNNNIYDIILGHIDLIHQRYLENNILKETKTGDIYGDYIEVVDFSKKEELKKDKS